MDCAKSGRLILQLRREKGMTQRALANRMNISDRTVSKWERGAGCPDVSLLPELSQALGVPVERLLSGDLEPNGQDGGNMKKIKFYVCLDCGNVLCATGEAEISCCGRRLAPLTARPADEAHAVTVEEIEDDLFVTLRHEMSKQHHLTFAAYVGYDRVLLVKLYPEQDPQARFPRISGGKLFVCCNEHGLFAAAGK